MKKNFIILLFVIFIANNLLAVEQLQHEKRFYTSPKGNIYIYKTKLGLTLSDSNNPSENILLKNVLKSLNFKFDQEGKNTIFHPTTTKSTHKSKKQDKSSVFYVYADWSSPVIKVKRPKGKSVIRKGRRYYKDQFIYNPKVTDRYSGVQSKYLSTNGQSYETFTSSRKFTEEKDYDLLFYAVDQVGNVSKPKKSRYGIDRTPPTTTFEVLINQYQDVLSPKSILRLKSQDEKVGVDKVFYQIVNGKTVQYKNTFRLKNLSEGPHELKYFASDRLANKETAKSYRFYFDKTPPTTMLKINGDYYVNGSKEYISTRSRIEITAQDNKVPVKEIQFKINKSKDWSVYAIPFPVLNRSTNQVITYHAHDAVDNESEFVKKKIILDRQAPITQIKFNGEKYTSRGINFINPNTIIEFKINDKLSGLQSYNVLIDNTIDTQNLKVSFEKFGKHTVEVTAKDNVNNINVKGLDVFVDNVQPTGAIEFSFGKVGSNGNVNIYPKNTKIYLSATDKHSGIKSLQYSINGQTAITYDSPLLIKKAGQYSIDVQVIDNVGNVYNISQKFNIK